MADLRVHAGDTTADFANRFTDAWRRAEAGASVNERHVSFDSFETLAHVLTPARLEILRRLHRQPAASLDSLAKTLNRAVHEVREDVETLTTAGLLDRDDDGPGLTAPYDAITTRIAL